MDKIEDDIEEDREGRSKEEMDEKFLIKTVPNCNKNEITFLEAIVSKINLYTLLRSLALLSHLILSDLIWPPLVSPYLI